MFVGDGLIERACLRQGDILERIPFPLLELKELRILGKLQSGEVEFPTPLIATAMSEHRKDPTFFIGQVLMRLSFCAVLSHCCELELKHQKFQPPAFSVARLIPVKDSIRKFPEKLASLRANKDPRDPDDPGYIDYFYISAPELLENQEWMVDFSQVVSLPNAEFPSILSHKILQMDDRSRVKFKIKGCRISWSDYGRRKSRWASRTLASPRGRLLASSSSRRAAAPSAYREGYTGKEVGQGSRLAASPNPRVSCGCHLQSLLRTVDQVLSPQNRLLGQNPRLPNKLRGAVSEGNFGHTFWATPSDRYPLEPQYIVLFD